MNKETESILKKTVKITSVTCLALGGAALIASGAALKACTEGAKYLKETIEKIVGEKPDAEVTAAETAAEEVTEAPVEEPAAEAVEVVEAECPDVVVSEDQA